MWCLTDAEKRVIVGVPDRSRLIAKKKAKKRSIAMAWREKKKKKGMQNKRDEKTSGMATSISGALSKSKDIPRDEKPVTGSALTQAPYKKKTKKR